MSRSLPLLAALPLGLLLLVPVVALVGMSSPGALLRAVRAPGFVSAFSMSVGTSAAALGVIALFGTPLGWALARLRERGRGALLEAVLQLPVVMPPVVVGLCLLLAFGRQGLGLGLAFTPLAVVLAQVVVAAPYYVRSAAAAFGQVDAELLLVARSLGAGRWEVLRKVALPMALPGLLSGLGLSWARALGEFGATLLFAGNAPGETQTMPLAIYSALEGDLALAMALSLSVVGLSVLVLAGLPVVVRGLLRWGRS